MADWQAELDQLAALSWDNDQAVIKYVKDHIVLTARMAEVVTELTDRSITDGKRIAHLDEDLNRTIDLLDKASDNMLEMAKQAEAQRKAIVTNGNDIKELRREIRRLQDAHGT